MSQTSVAELVGAIRERGGRLPFEISAFVALETCEQVLQGPARVSASDVHISSEGKIGVNVTPHSASGAEAARSVVGVLAHLLEAAGTGVPPMLSELVEQGPSDGTWDLGRLRDDLEASLVPLNRSASRRVLSRLLREQKRARPSTRPPKPVPPSNSDIDADLDALLGASSAPPPPPRKRSAPPAPPKQAGGDNLPSDEDIDDALDALLGGSLPAPSKVPAEAGTSKSPPSFPSDAIPSSMLSEDSLPSDEFPTEEFKAVAAALDNALDEQIHEQSTEPPPAPAPATPATPKPAADDEVREMAERVSREPTAPHPSYREVEPARRKSSAPPPRMERGMPDLDGFEDATGKRKGGAIIVVGLLIVVVGFVALIAIKPEIFGGIFQPPEPEGPTEEELAAQEAEERAAAEAELRSRYGDLSLSVQPERAQVLLFLGRGPAVAENLPIGVAHEFIAIADGREPTRAIVPSDATWSPVDEETQQYELAMQTGEREMSFEDIVLGDTRLPRDAMGSPTGSLGRVRVITTPPDARVYYLIGFAPSVEVRRLPTDEPHELLLYHEGYQAQRVFVGPSDWREVDGQKSAELSVSLEER